MMTTPKEALDHIENHEAMTVVGHRGIMIIREAFERHKAASERLSEKYCREQGVTLALRELLQRVLDCHGSYPPELLQEMRVEAEYRDDDE